MITKPSVSDHTRTGSEDHDPLSAATIFVNGVAIISSISTEVIEYLNRRFCDGNRLAMVIHLAMRGEVFDYEPVVVMFEY